MKLIFEYNSNVMSFEVTHVEYIHATIDILHPMLFPYLILEDKDGSYIQIAGKSDRLTAEIRKVTIENTNHYVIGMIEISLNQEIIDCKVGPIIVF